MCQQNPPAWFGFPVRFFVSLDREQRTNRLPSSTIFWTGFSRYANQKLLGLTLIWSYLHTTTITGNSTEREIFPVVNMDSFIFLPTPWIKSSAQLIKSNKSQTTKHALRDCLPCRVGYVSLKKVAVDFTTHLGFVEHNCASSCSFVQLNKVNIFFLRSLVG